MDTMEIAKIIFDQIKASDPRAMMCWGVSQKVALGEYKIGDRLQLGGLQLTVNGAKHKGKVLIRLMANDTYTVEIGRIYKGQWKAKSVRENVFCDNLMAYIDSQIEGYYQENDSVDIFG